MSRIVDIRPGMAADADAVRACARAAYTQYIAAIGREPAPMIADFDAAIAAGHLHVAERAGTFAGFIVFYARGASMHLENVAVSDPHHGVGSALISHCEEVAQRGGLATVDLYTNAAMTANLTLYSRLGYHEVDRRTEDGFARVYFEKSLPSGAP